MFLGSAYGELQTTGTGCPVLAVVTWSLESGLSQMALGAQGVAWPSVTGVVVFQLSGKKIEENVICLMI